MSDVEIVQVEGQSHGARLFQRVPALIYDRAWPAWTPTLAGDERRLFDRSKNPSLAETDAARWVVCRAQRPVGRVAAFAPRTPSDAGYFGLFECIDDAAVAAVLLRAVESWLADRGRTRSIGPLLINPRDQIGLLTEGFERPASLLTPYNPPYYAALLEHAGYGVAVRLRAYAWKPVLPGGPATEELDRRLTSRSYLKIRTIDKRRLEAEALVLADVINRSFADTWRWTPITRAETERMAEDLAPIVDPTLCLVAEDASGPCGVALTLPDANWLVRRMGGSLWPFGWATALRLRRRIPWARFMALAVLPGRRATGTAVRLMVATHRALLTRGFEYAELSQVFEDNLLMRRMLEHLGCVVVKRYAVYERSLTGGVGGAVC